MSLRCYADKFQFVERTQVCTSAYPSAICAVWYCTKDFFVHRNLPAVPEALPNPESALLTPPCTTGLFLNGTYYKNPTYDQNRRSDLTVYKHRRNSWRFSLFKHFFSEINWTILALLEGSADIFANNSEAEQLHSAKKQDQHNNSCITGNINAND